MVEQILLKKNESLLNKVINNLEKYLIVKSNYKLIGNNYDLIFLVANNEKDLLNTTYSLIISSIILNRYNQRDVIMDLFQILKDNLTPIEYTSVFKLNIIHTSDPFVKNINFLFEPFKEKRKITEIIDFSVGNVYIRYGYLLKSLILDDLFQNKNVTFILKNEEQIKVQSKAIQNNFDIETSQGIIKFDDIYQII